MFGHVAKKQYLCTSITMDNKDVTIEEVISQVLADIRQKGFSAIQPFSIGKMEVRMSQFAQINQVTLASDELYMSAKQLQHCMRASKSAKGLVVDDAEAHTYINSYIRMITNTTYDYKIDEPGHFKVNIYKIVYGSNGFEKSNEAPSLKRNTSNGFSFSKTCNS